MCDIPASLSATRQHSVSREPMYRCVRIFPGGSMHFSMSACCCCCTTTVDRPSSRLIGATFARTLDRMCSVVVAVIFKLHNLWIEGDLATLKSFVNFAGRPAVRQCLSTLLCRCNFLQLKTRHVRCCPLQTADQLLQQRHVRLFSYGKQT